jgi:hypothetical protein
MSGVRADAWPVLGARATVLRAAYTHTAGRNQVGQDPISQILCPSADIDLVTKLVRRKTQTVETLVAYLDPRNASFAFLPDACQILTTSNTMIVA